MGCCNDSWIISVKCYRTSVQRTRPLPFESTRFGSVTRVLMVKFNYESLEGALSGGMFKCQNLERATMGYNFVKNRPKKTFD